MYEEMESLLIKCLNCQDYSTKLHFLGTNYVETLNVQLEIFNVLMKDGEFTCLDDIKCMMNEIIIICKLLLVNPATSAAGERSFSSARID